MSHSIFLMNPIGSVEKTWGNFLNEAYLRRTYLQGQTHVLAGTDARTCVDGCSTLRGGMQCTAWTVALHCRGGCSALRLRRAKGAQKSPVLFWTREMGGETRPMRVTVAPRKSPLS